MSVREDAKQGWSVSLRKENLQHEGQGDSSYK